MAYLFLVLNILIKSLLCCMQYHFILDLGFFWNWSINLGIFFLPLNAVVTSLTCWPASNITIWRAVAQWKKNSSLTLTPISWNKKKELISRIFPSFILNGPIMKIFNTSKHRGDTKYFVCNIFYQHSQTGFVKMIIGPMNFFSIEKIWNKLHVCEAQIWKHVWKISISICFLSVHLNNLHNVENF